MAALALDVAGGTVARVSAEEHMANYRAAGTLLGSPKGLVLGERESMRRSDRDFRHHPEAGENFLILPSSFILSLCPR